MRKTILFAGTLMMLMAPCRADDNAQPIYYREHGAVGDGVADDLDAIIRAHAAANKAGRPVRADAGATYRIGGANKTAQIQTDTDWGDATFIIDDTSVENRSSHVFRIASHLPSTKVTSVATLKKGQAKLDLTLDYPALVIATDNATKRYIRYGLNQNSGAAQTDVFIVGKDGAVDPATPVIWDFNAITAMTAYPIDPATLTVKGGRFTTIANQEEAKYNYYSRGISVMRSNVLLDGLRHTVTGEGDHGAPYGGFIVVTMCANVTVRNCVLTGHKTYSTIGSAGKPVTMGTYDLSVNKAVNVTFKDCKQADNIHDTRRWGILGSNYSKNLTYDTVAFSRFDAHMGVANATIRNSVLGHQGINIIGCGTFLLEGSKVCGGSLVNLREDYGSTWEGEIIIRNCEYVPRNGKPSDATLISGANSGQHDFGYPCHMPRKITIDGLTIDDRAPPNGYAGPKLFAAFNRAHTSEDYQEKYPYQITQEVAIKRLTTTSGKPHVISSNPFLFRNVKITEP